MDDHTPLVIKLVRHGQSMSNVGAVNAAECGDHSVALTPHGHDQARAAGENLGANFLSQALVYCSPYRRTRETLAGLFAGADVDPANVRVYEDPRLREVDPGYADWEAQQPMREIHGWFYYRFQGGESPADCYDRTSSFLESLLRQVERKQARRAVVVTHGLTIRCFVMRFLHLTVEQFDQLANPDNCDIITIAPKSAISDPLFTSGQWGVAGLRIREE
jgi:broad specificity phosphatase PhoE